MAEPFKEVFNAQTIAALAQHVAQKHPGFDKEGFVAAATADLSSLEMKDRSMQIAKALGERLPEDFDEAASILEATLAPERDVGIGEMAIGELGVEGWMIWPMGQVVVDRGMGHFDRSMQALNAMTRRFSTEFAVRFFIQNDSERALTIMKGWLGDESVHVRRLVSEGTRPRLPWGIRLNHFVSDPQPLLPILKALRDDPSEYVRRSVANNLNDIAKDHPDLVAELAQEWMKDAPAPRQKLIRHACRTLVKNGHRGALKALGFGAPEVELSGFEVKTPLVKMGEAAVFGVEVRSTASKPQKLVLDYVVHHVKANGKRTEKVFKWKKWTLKAGEVAKLERKHPFKAISTRKYYSGEHSVELLINGERFPGGDFTLDVG